MPKNFHYLKLGRSGGLCSSDTAEHSIQRNYFCCVICMLEINLKRAVWKAKKRVYFIELNMIVCYYLDKQRQYKKSSYKIICVLQWQALVAPGKPLSFSLSAAALLIGWLKLLVYHYYYYFAVDITPTLAI